MWYIFGFFGLFLGFSLYSRRFKNPHSLTFIFGKKGSGKSTLMIKMMLRDIRRGWHVYTDMPDVNITGVHYFQTKDLAKFAPPPHSSIYLDEVGLSMNNRDFAKFPTGLREYFKLQRKFRNKVTVNSQAYDVDLTVRNVTDSMILQTNIGNVIGVSRPIIRSITLTEASSQGDSRIADQLKFGKIWTWRLTWMPAYFKWFQSYNPPARDDLPNVEIVGRDPARPTAKEQLSKLRRNFRKR